MGYLVFGDDERMNEVRKLLTADVPDDICAVYPPNKILTAEDIKTIPWGARVFTGRVDGAAVDAIKRKSLNVIFYNDSPVFCEYNAMNTAEAVIAIILGKIKTQLRENKVLVIGFGRCGRAISKYLYALNADYTIMTSRPDMAEIYTGAVGYDGSINDFDIIINTAPSRVISDEKLTTVKRGAIIVDIASKPYGLDHEFAKTLDIDCSVYPALPSKYRPVSGALAIYNRVTEGNQ